MPIDLPTLCRSLKPERTILVFGAGSSIPSGGPSGANLAADLLDEFKYDPDPSLTLADAATIIEKRFQRRALIAAVRRRIAHLKPSGGLLALPRFDWAAVYTTNYDRLIEDAYRRVDKPLHVYSSNFDFTEGGHTGGVALYKIHGTIDKDVADGHNSRMILTGADYDLASQYRELLYNKIRDQLATHSVVIVGYSLSDPDLRSLIEEAARLKAREGAPGKITLFIFSRNDNQAVIFEDRGFEVAFGDLDSFTAALLNAAPSGQLVLSVTSDPLDAAPKIHPATVEVAAATASQAADLNKMFNGRAASYADIARGWTFPRTLAGRLETQLSGKEKRIGYIIGAAGVGKTTAVRQALYQLSKRDIRCFEHKRDFAIPTDAWLSVDRELRKRKETAVLFIDDAHEHMREVNRLADGICANPTPALKLVLTSAVPTGIPGSNPQ